MNKELIEYISIEVSILINSGFYNKDEILEIIEEQFIDEDISLNEIKTIIFDKYNKKIEAEANWEEKTDFDKLKNCFNHLNNKSILMIHNAGYSVDEGVHDSFEVFHHLQIKNIVPEGFCFYHFQDIEYALESNILSLAFEDFQNNKEKSLKIGKLIVKTLYNNDFIVKWNEDINSPIKINPFHWKKRLDDDEYEMEGAYNSFLDKSEN
ncbi:hypothetical protein ALNOE001_02250 [Candidatus Methanobinarius endosymbioticus]|uniref:DUF6891 domain-containing protein n=1 Tax=Candidatus Methanobinarius endosymbioticus TaxID=2006182 RepID=A0A366MFF1_9EURY|nr:hypothetical protein ALNOE001_02250 [Candidatus Methanobinarius endosymbioticus]